MSTKASLKSISKDLGLSAGTISRVLNGKAKQFRISDSTVKLVKDYAEKVGYTPNLIAKGLQASKTHTLGLMIPNIADPFFSALAKNIEKAASKSNYSIILVDAEESVEREKLQVRNLLSRNVDGIIAAPVVSDYRHFQEIVNKKIPIIFIDNYSDELDIPSITSDNFTGGYLATEELISHGHKRIGILKGVLDGAPLKQRLQGYQKALLDHGIQPSIELEAGDYFSIDQGYVGTMRLLRLPDRPTAIFATSCELGLGALKALKEMGLHAPEDISLVFFDNQPYLSFIDPPITTVGQDYDTMGKAAVSALLKLIEKECREVKSEVIPTKFIGRESVKYLSR